MRVEVQLAVASRFLVAVHEGVASLVVGALGAARLGGVHQKLGAVVHGISLVVGVVFNLTHGATLRLLLLAQHGNGVGYEGLHILIRESS